MKSPPPPRPGTSSTRHMTEEMSEITAIDASESAGAAGIAMAGVRRSSDGSVGRTSLTRSHIPGAGVFPEGHETRVSAGAGFVFSPARRDDGAIASNAVPGVIAEGIEAQAEGLPDGVEPAIPEPALGNSVG